MSNQTDTHQQFTRHSLLPLLTDRNLVLYNLAIIVLGPMFLLRKIKRHFSKKTAYEFLRHRWTIPVEGGEKDDPNALHVVFVSTGFGEKHTTEQLTAALKEVRPNVRTTWAVKADATVENIRQTSPDQSVTYMPFDFMPSVALWLKKLRPDVVVSVEKLWVPNIIWCSRRWGAPVVVVSGRRGRFAGGGAKGSVWRNINHWTLCGYNIMGLQSEIEIERLKAVLPEEVDTRITGIIKISRSAAVRPTFEELAAWLESRNPQKLPIIVAGSTTFEGEEKFVLEAFEKTRAQVPCLLLLAPRRLHRVDEVQQIIESRGLKVGRRSEYPSQITSSAQPDVLLLDSMGELSSSYSFGQASFVGGTLQGPGHNVFEPLEWGVSVCYGPGDGKTVPITQTLAEEAGVGFRVHTPEEMAQKWTRALQDVAWRESLREKCEQIMEEQRQALQQNLKVIVEMIDQVSGKVS